MADKPVRVAIVGGGCGAIAAAFELTRPEHQGKYQVTVYQLGWRLGGKGASGRGPANRIEEHGLHLWLGFYENAFRLLRECYAELGRDPETCPIADWRDAFFPDPHVGIMERAGADGWKRWTAYFPPAPGLPGDPRTPADLLSLRGYMSRTVALLRTLLLSVPDKAGGIDRHADPVPAEPSDETARQLATLLRYGALATLAGLRQALVLLERALGAIPRLPESDLLGLVERLAGVIRVRLERLIGTDEDFRYRWEIIDLVLAILLGTVRFGLLTHPRGLEAIDEFDCREWLRMNGAAERSLNSAFMRGLYDLAMAYEDGDPNRPRLAAGQALRGALRMFFTYRGALFWKMRVGMGDAVFAPFYEVLRRRGVAFAFFHRLEDVQLADPASLVPGERPYVAALRFDVQAETKNGLPYEPLIDVRGLPCWPACPDFAQLQDGARLQAESWDFESHWDRRKRATKTLRVTRDFDMVVLGVSAGVIPYVCKGLIARDSRWRAMVATTRTVASQALQIWLREDLSALGWTGAPATIAAFAKPFDTWSDMSHVIPYETWHDPPRSVVYFCGALADPPAPPDDADRDYPRRRRAEVRQNAIDLLERHAHHLWPDAAGPGGGFRWETLAASERAETSSPADQGAIDGQFWSANVNPTDRYVLALPGSLQHRISPLDNSYDNLTVAGDWTDCGFNEGCVEAAVMSGRLAAHAIAHFPPLEEIVGYDHP